MNTGGLGLPLRRYVTPCKKLFSNISKWHPTFKPQCIYPNLTVSRPIFSPISAAGGGAYYFAKKSINADRAQRHEEAQRLKEEAARREHSAKLPLSSGRGGLTNVARAKSAVEMDDTGSPSREASHDPAATRHEPETPAERVDEKGKYEAAEQFTSRKGNRL
ncbi:hypothetical protein ACJ73_08887 [Blastomyces percursus]|uniref:Uncharacterized protein n=1 Tax=Blastomyces percursus TaxID=1658174 RepID=A0A1J9QJQ5_9EURO|nr:hypothetical protein ACJ73_08887 [Blastomyces percursus]